MDKNKKDGEQGGGDGGDSSKEVVLKKGQVVVDEKTLAGILEKQSALEIALENESAKRAGLEEMFAAEKGADTTGQPKLRERKNFEPSFRTVGIKKMPVAGNHEDQAFVIGWTNRGAYQKVDRSGVSPQIIDYIDVFFLGREKNEKGVLQAESVRLLDLIGATEVVCKILDTKKETRKVPTGEEINVSVWDPKHGLVSTGDLIDGWVAYTDTTFKIQIPGVIEPVEIDEKYCNI